MKELFSSHGWPDEFQEEKFHIQLGPFIEWVQEQYRAKEAAEDENLHADARDWVRTTYGQEEEGFQTHLIIFD